MIELQKEDIPLLDFIIDELCVNKSSSIDIKYLQEKQLFGFGKKEFTSVDNLVFEEDDEFKRILSIFEHFKCAEIVITFSDKKRKGIAKNSKTLQFKRQGGFKNEFKKEERIKLREKKQDEILDLDVTLKRFESKIGRKIIVAGIIISVLNFLITISTIKLSENNHNNSKKVEQVNDLKLNKGQEKLLDTLK